MAASGEGHLVSFHATGKLKLNMAIHPRGFLHGQLCGLSFLSAAELAFLHTETQEAMLVEQREKRPERDGKRLQ